MNNTEKKVLVLGGTGKTGSRVVQKLMQRGWPVRIGSRSESPSFDWLDTATWKPALQGIHSVYISFQPDLAVPGATDAIRAFTEVAVKNGVRKLVLLSGRGEEEAQACEQIVMNAGVEWTVLRASWFNQNFSEGHLLEPILAGHVVLPASDVKEPFVDTEDIADAAVAALTEEGHAGRLYELTGPELLSFAEAIQIIARAGGRPIRFEQVPMDDYTAMLREVEVPQDLVWLLGYLFTEVLDGRNEHLTDGVQQALGRAPKDFTTYAREAAAVGVWSAVTT